MSRRRSRTNDPPYAIFRLQGWQQEILERFVRGGDAYDPTWPPPLDDGERSAEDLVRAALEGTIGQPFFPGIEAGVLLLDPTIYRRPFDFRLDPTRVLPGHLTALMALPWQADFYDCDTDWWPTQRPNHLASPTGSPLAWDCGKIKGDGTSGPGTGPHRRMVEHVMKLGVVTRDSTGAVIEQGRHTAID